MEIVHTPRQQAKITVIIEDERGARMFHVPRVGEIDMSTDYEEPPYDGIGVAIKGGLLSRVAFDFGRILQDDRGVSLYTVTDKNENTPGSRIMKVVQDEIGKVF